MNATAFDGVLDVSASQQDRHIERPWMVMQGAVVVAAPELVQVDIEHAVSRDDPPSLKVRMILSADGDVRFAGVNVAVVHTQ